MMGISASEGVPADAAFHAVDLAAQLNAIATSVPTDKETRAEMRATALDLLLSSMVARVQPSLTMRELDTVGRALALLGAYPRLTQCTHSPHQSCTLLIVPRALECVHSTCTLHRMMRPLLTVARALTLRVWCRRVP
jgi:hypothetical protein